VFAVPVGWGGPTIFLASDDAVNWRHLTSGASKLPEASGRFLAFGANRSDTGPKFGHLFASDDQGQTWKWLAPKELVASTGRGCFYQIVML
jgi:hypothetical protein